MRLLLVEDERSLAKALSAILEKNNYSVDTVYNGAEALDYIESGNYDGIIMDVMMPVLDGISALKIMRERGCKTPVLILSAKSETDDKVLGLDNGANDYLTKPFAMQELLARIRAMTRVGSEHPAATLKYGNAVLDSATFTLSAPSGETKLASKEYQMLELLMRNPTHLISTEKFMERVWGYDSDAEINVVWVYISYLRKKLTGVGANIEIKAHRGAGYSLEICGE